MQSYLWKFSEFSHLYQMKTFYMNCSGNTFKPAQDSQIFTPPPPKKKSNGLKLQKNNKKKKKWTDSSSQFNFMHLIFFKPKQIESL